MYYGEKLLKDKERHQRVSAYNHNEEGAFSGSLTSTQPIITDNITNSYGAVENPVSSIVKGIFLFFFGIPFMSVPAIMFSTTSLESVPGGVKFVMIAFSIPFFLVGLFISLIGLGSIISGITNKPTSELPFFKHLYQKNRRTRTAVPPIAPPSSYTQSSSPSQNPSNTYSYCMFCGAKLPPNAVVCPKCGASVES